MAVHGVFLTIISLWFFWGVLVCLYVFLSLPLSLLSPLSCKILCEMNGEEEGIATSEIDLPHLEDVRTRMPVTAHYRDDVFGTGVTGPPVMHVPVNSIQLQISDLLTSFYLLFMYYSDQCLSSADLWPAHDSREYAVVLFSSSRSFNKKRSCLNWSEWRLREKHKLRDDEMIREGGDAGWGRSIPLRIINTLKLILRKHGFCRLPLRGERETEWP